jgi:hypothetical protein
MRATDKSTTLSEVAQVQPGYLSRGRVRVAADGTHRLLQAKDVSSDTGVRIAAAVRFRPERNPELYRVSRGDILLAARGQDHRAHLITEDLTDTLASSVFYILRPQADRVLPGYLAWWLNLPAVQAEIDAGSYGTGIDYLSRETLERLPVPVPALSIQHQIQRVVALWQEQKSLEARLAETREQYIHAVCLKGVRRSRE